MYKLTLARIEREAFDFVGDRYQTGYKVARLLIELLEDSELWESDEDLDFQVPEHVAWQIEQLSADENHLWPLFSSDLVEKMIEFCCGVV